MPRFSRKSKPVEERSAIDPYDGKHQDALARLSPDLVSGRQYPGASAAARTSAAETCARWWAGALGSANVVGDPYGAVTADVLAQVGRELIRSGEAAYLIDVTGGTVRLLPASTFWLEGPPDPARWRYRLTMSGPSGSRTVTVSPDAVVHLTWARLPSSPWRGTGPLALAREGARRAWAAETRLGDLASVSVRQGQILTAERGADEDDIQEFVDDMRDWQEANTGSPFVTTRQLGTTDIHRGMTPDAADNENARQALAALAASCGIPPVLISAEPTAAAGQREAYRQFVHASVSPMADTLAAEFARKLETPDIAFEFTELRAADIAGRARAYRSLTDAGFPHALAAEACGLPELPADYRPAPEPADEPQAVHAG